MTLQRAYGFLLAGGILLAGALWVAPALAEDGKKEVTLEPVTVSAQKREENVQEVPLSLGVLSDIALEESGISEFSDIKNIMPGLYIGSPGSGTYSFISIRGRGNSPMDMDPAVTVLVDGVPYDDFYSVANNLLFDVERVEGLRGPQSTMYGMNSQAGVINIISKKPGQAMRVSLSGEGGFGAEQDFSHLLSGHLSGPIIADTLAGGLSFMTKGQNGYIKNQSTGERFNDSRNSGVRGNFVFTPHKAWNISGGVAYTKLKSNMGYIFTPYNAKAAKALGQKYEKWALDADWEGDTDLDTLGTNLTIAYQFEGMELSSISAYRNSEQEYDFDSDLTATPAMFGRSQSEFQTFTQEVRLQSKTDSPSALEWMAGYFLHYFAREQAMGMGNPATPSAFSPMYSTDLVGISHAFFGQGTYRFLDGKMGLTLGLRQEWTQREVEDLTKTHFKEESSHDSILLPKLALDYRITPDAMLYASISRGWRSGGVNSFVANADQVHFDKETCWAYEVGAKTTWLDGRLMLNASAFYTDYRDYQDAVRTGFLTQYLSNVPSVRMIGFETEMEAHLSQAVNLTGGLGYVNARYMDFPDAVVGNYDGNTVAMVPDFTGHLALRYSFLEHFYVRPEVVGVGNIYWDRANTQRQNPYLICNLRAGYSKDAYEVYVYARNLTNQHAFSYATDYFGNGNYYGNPIAPLCVGLGASVKF